MGQCGIPRLVWHGSASEEHNIPQTATMSTRWGIRLKIVHKLFPPPSSFCYVFPRGDFASSFSEESDGIRYANRYFWTLTYQHRTCPTKQIALKRIGSLLEYGETSCAIILAQHVKDCWLVDHKEEREAMLCPFTHPSIWVGLPKVLQSFLL